MRCSKLSRLCLTLHVDSQLEAAVPVPSSGSRSGREGWSSSAADRSVWKGGQAMSEKLSVADWFMLGGLLVLAVWGLAVVVALPR